ncbi:hypothetical protein Tco_0937910 [Tanacetum coccineum]|uniref:Transmembrane protein n=1 Tax=Tanacetum coccineum TaxID=301880 RepID=A0ABQ5DFL7_9ASTR
MRVEFGCHIEVELESEFHGEMGNGGCETTCGDVKVFLMQGFVVLSTFEVLQMLGFFLQMGFTLILATLDGLDVGLLGDVIGEDDCDEDE